MYVPHSARPAVYSTLVLRHCWPLRIESRDCRTIVCLFQCSDETCTVLRCGHQICCPSVVWSFECCVCGLTSRIVCIYGLKKQCRCHDDSIRPHGGWDWNSVWNQPHWYAHTFWRLRFAQNFRLFEMFVISGACLQLPCLVWLVVQSLKALELFGSILELIMWLVVLCHGVQDISCWQTFSWIRWKEQRTSLELKAGLLIYLLLEFNSQPKTRYRGRTSTKRKGSLRVLGLISWSYSGNHNYEWLWFLNDHE